MIARNGIGVVRFGSRVFREVSELEDGYLKSGGVKP